MQYLGDVLPAGADLRVHVGDRLRREQHLLERFGGRKVGQRRAFAHPDADSYTRHGRALELQSSEDPFAHDDKVRRVTLGEHLHQLAHRLELHFHRVGAKALRQGADEGLDRTAGEHPDHRPAFRRAFSRSRACASGGTASP
jgi:hypothetical protein